ncbi:MAG: 3-methylornithyl-N6-L-lysine dehydrogenase PylD [Oscillospiraceae bacterium]
MTRLAESDIDTILSSLDELDRLLLKITGCNLLELSARASGVEMSAVRPMKIAVVPVTAGQGLIGGFSQTVCGILTHIGMDAFVTKKTDIGGMHEAFLNAEAQISADDDNFIAYHKKTGICTENSDATGRGFAAALEAAASHSVHGGIRGKKVLIAGAGIVGLSAAGYLHARGAEAVVFDTNPDRLAGLPYRTITAVGAEKFPLILEATSSADVIGEEHVLANTIIAAPGMPLGVEQQLAARLLKENRLIHNTLELGTAVMITGLMRGGAETEQPCL